ncbi:putative Ig domain-containing protein [Flexivirga lutea]
MNATRRPVRSLLTAVLVLITAMTVAMIDVPTSRAATLQPVADGGSTVLTHLNSYSDACQNFVFIGARGSGVPATEGNGMGNIVNSALSTFNHTMGNDAFSENLGVIKIGFYAVPYTAADVLTLIPPTSTPYFGSIDGGVLATISFLNARIKQCPYEHYVLAGHSQGAMVMHRLVEYLAAHEQFGNGIVSDPNSDNRVLSRVSAVIAVGDGDRVAGDKQATYGSVPDLLGTDIGIARLPLKWSPWRKPVGAAQFPILGGLPDGPDWKGSKRYLSVCNFRDIVCDTGTVIAETAGATVLPDGPLMKAVMSATFLNQGVNVHNGYSDSDPLYQAAITAESLALSDFTPLTIHGSPPPAEVGKSYYYQLTAVGGAPPYTFGATGLPAGLSIDPATGVISGTPTTISPGYFQVGVKDSLGTQADAAVQIPVTSPGLVKQITAGGRHTCALLVDGSVDCWGDNSFGELGGSSVSPDGTRTPVSGLSSGVASISAGSQHTCALLTSGGVECWGNNSSGELGDGTTNNSPTPVPVTGLASGVASISAGGAHTCAVLTSGGAVCWGANYWGELGDGTTVNSTVPVPVTGLSSGVASISAGGGLEFTCALLTTGGVECWGSNNVGQVGNSTRTGYGDIFSIPVPVTGLSSGVASVSAGDSHACALLVSGGVECWGIIGNTIASSPVPATGLTSNAVSISVGGMHTCAVLTTGGAECWGTNYSGQLGNGTTVGSTLPVPVTGLSSGVASISAGDIHTCALLAGGGVDCWGYNYYGQLGNGTTVGSTVPVRVTGLS